MGGQRFPGDNAGYGNRMAPSRPESYIDSYGYASSSRRSPAPFGPVPHRRGFGPRNNSEPMMHSSHPRDPRGSNMYNDQRREQRQQNYTDPQTYDTATQGSASGQSHGTEPWNTSTNPSSENSSVDRFQQAQAKQPPKPDLGESYGFSGFGGAPQGLDYNQDPSNYGVSGSGLDRRPVARNDGPPPPPPHNYSNYQASMRQPPQGQPQQGQPPRGPNALRKQRASTFDTGGSFKERPDSSKQRPETGEKRKSWLMRRFSKNG